MERSGEQRPRYALIGLAAVFLIWPSIGQSRDQAQHGPPPTVIHPVHFDVSPPLRHIKPIPPPKGKPHEVEEHEPPFGLNKLPAGAPIINNQTTPHVLQTWNGPVSMPTMSLNFEGVGKNFTGPGGTYTVNVAPPDTEGDVGLNYYVQWVNTSFAVFNKTTGAAVYGPAAGNTLWSGFGGPCQTDNDGDPIVKYDEEKQRWIMAQFAVDSSPYYECIAVSQTSDPTGSWYRYAFSFGSSFNDYPKLAVWRDAYYATYNMFNSAGTSYLGAEVCAYDRDSMVAGSPTASAQCFGPSALSAYFGLEPADVDGSTLPPSGEPEFVMAFDQDTLNRLLLWKFHVDWTTPTNSTFSGPSGLTVASFSPTCSGYTRQACIPQTGTTTQLEALSYDMMFRLAYRNLGTYESLVLNHSVTGTGNSGIRWYEVRDPNGTPAIYQSGTFQPDPNWRWMGSIAMDKGGNMALGYSVSSSTTHPSIYYVGRLVGDAAGTMPQGETLMMAGNGSQTTWSQGALQRWGDYSAMSVDPSDGCTFWYTQEYLAENGSFNWHTRIGNFRYPTVAAPTNVNAQAPSDNLINLSWNTSGASTYFVYRATAEGGPYAEIATVPSPLTAYSDYDVSGGVTYYYVVSSAQHNECTAPYSAPPASVMASGGCNLPPSFTGLSTVAAPTNATCELDLSWSGATASCGGPVTYSVYRSTTDAFTPSPANRIAVGLTATSYADASGLASGTRYYYVVRATDETNGVEDDNTVQRSGVPVGPLVVGTWTDDAGDTGTAQLSLTPPWSVATTGGHSGPNVYLTGTYFDDACVAAVTPPLQLATNAQLTFWSKYDIETGYDKGEVEISTNGGSTWTRVPVNYPTNSTRTGDACGLPRSQRYFTGTNLTWSQYSASLATWNNQTVKLRWVLSSDPGGVQTGWWVDDIAISNAYVPGSCSAAPDDVQFLTVKSMSGQNTLEWQNPASGPYDHAVVRYNTGGTYPSTPTDGTGVTCDSQDTANSHYNSCTHAITPGTIYSYTVFVEDSSSQYSSGKHVQAVWPTGLPTSVKWGYWTGAATLAPPGIRPGALGTGAVYQVSNDRVFHAMNPGTDPLSGDWPRTLGWFPLAMNGPAQSRPPIIPDSVGTSASAVAFLGSQDGYVYAVNANTGAELWATPAPQPGDIVQAAPAGVFKKYGATADLVFVGTRNATAGNTLLCLNAADGSTAWSFDNSPNGDIGMISADAWADYSGKLYFTSRARAGGSSQTVWCLDYTASSATKCSSFNPSTSIGDIDSSPVLYQGVLYVGNNAGTVYALDPTSGSTLGSYATGDGAVKGFITPAFTALPRKLYLATTNKIWCLSHNDNGNTGTSITEIWDTGATIAGPSIPILRVGTNDLYAGSTDGKLYQVDVTAPGSPTPLSLGSATVGSPAIDVVNGLLHVGTEAGVVYAITLPLS